MNDMKQSISLLIKPASYDCNLACDYCFYKRTEESYPDTSLCRMDEDTFSTLVQKAQGNGRQAVSYIWQGGEPMIMGLDFFERAMEIQNTYRAPNQTISNTIQTNGILINSEWAQFFARHQFLVGLSIDGPRELHDIHRFTSAKKNVFDRVMSARDVLNEYKVDFNILAVVTKETVEYPAEIYNFFIDQDFHYLQFIDCLEVVDGEIAPFSVNQESYGNFLCKLFDEWFKNGYPYVNIRLFDNLLQYRIGFVPECCMYKSDCGSYFVIEHNGDVYPCDFFVLKEWYLGNICEDSFDDIISSPKHIEFSDIRNTERNECEACEWLGFCQRGCIKFRYWPDMDYTSLNYLCGAYKKFFEHTKDRYNFLAWDIMRRRNGLPAPTDIGRNDPCVCGSGKKFKKCCEPHSFLMKK